nr:MAG TPA: tail length tape measure protein [Caudoviricetes sp.]
MNDSTIRLSADTSALTDSLSKIAEEMTAMKDAVSSSAAAMGANLDASAKQAEATNAAIHGLDESVKTVTDSIEAQTKTVTDLGTKQSKVTKEISKALETQNSQQKDANTTLAEQKKIMQEQETEIKKVTKAVDNQTGVLKKNASGWKMLMTGFAIKFASEIVDGFKSIISTGLEASRVYEDMSARLTPLVGDLETAQKTFWSLNGLEDETATATDKLAKAFVDLGNNGLTNSNEQLKTYATIAHGTGRDINTLTDAVIAFSQGSTKALRQFGITAKDNGDTISLTYKGSTTEIQKNSKALDEYLSNLARNNFDGVLETKLNTVSAATGRLDNAWGTFCTRLMQSDGGFGELIIMGNDFLANTLNGISEWLDDPAVIEWFHTLAKTVRETFEGIRTAWDSVKDFFSDTLELIGVEMKDGTGNWKLFFSNFFQFAQIGILELSQKVGKLWDNTVGYLNAVGEGIGSALSGGEFSRGLDAARAQTKREAEETAKIYKATIAGIEKEITESQNRIAAERQRLAEKYQNKPIGEGTQYDEGLRIGVNKDSGKGKGGGDSSKALEAKDTWTPYYEQILELDIRSKGDLEQLKWEHARKLSEFNAVIAENARISETEKNNALLIIQQDYQRQRAEIEKSSMDFINSLNPEDEEIVRLQESYSRKLEMLEQYYNDRLISEENYLQEHAALMDQYTTDSTAAKQKKQSEDLKKMMEPYEKMADATISISDAFDDLSANMNESSGAYKALFAVQKSFAVASATMDAVQAWIKALNDQTAVTWPQKLANYASAVATTTAAISQLTSVSMHDKGGFIKPGELGIVGEYGPELIEGPASVTSRRKTADLARSALTAQESTSPSYANVVINLYESQDKAGTVETSEDDESRIINIFVSDIRRGGDMSAAIQNTFNLKRVGA